MCDGPYFCVKIDNTFWIYDPDGKITTIPINNAGMMVVEGIDGGYYTPLEYSDKLDKLSNAAMPTMVIETPTPRATELVELSTQTSIPTINLTSMPLTPLATENNTVSAADIKEMLITIFSIFGGVGSLLFIFLGGIRLVVGLTSVGSNVGWNVESKDVRDQSVALNPEIIAPTIEFGAQMENSRRKVQPRRALPKIKTRRSNTKNSKKDTSDWIQGLLDSGVLRPFKASDLIIPPEPTISPYGDISGFNGNGDDHPQLPSGNMEQRDEIGDTNDLRLNIFKEFIDKLDNDNGDDKVPVDKK
jgi:hypothetical protein